ncbi:hypothetical protein HX776_12135 [Pseudomonas agarici]|uniref:hypothetical protein n=1 Tax=Pseudomonas agarici TaxID=46677 RepID=UPI0002F53F78|nr:hypothetical protein [Pseudomonas agarici]NWC09559.1 hypothetical protein [Pseudomonas agarici]
MHRILAEARARGDARLKFSARDSLAKIVGQSLHWTAGETIALGSSYDTHVVAGYN